MASIMEEFVSVIEAENQAYKELTNVSRSKTDAIVYARIDELTKITEKEQLIMENIMILDKKRLAIRNEMSNILKVPAESLTLLGMANMLDKRPEEKQKILDLREELRMTLIDIATINKENGTLLKQSMEMLEYDMNLVRSTRVAPRTANYNNKAYNTDAILPGSGFNVKQ